MVGGGELVGTEEVDDVVVAAAVLEGHRLIAVDVPAPAGQGEQDSSPGARAPCESL